MRKFITFILFLATFFIGIIGVLEFLYRGVNNPIESKFLSYSASNNSPILFIGNSHSGAIGKPLVNSLIATDNFSIGGQDIFHIYAILKTIIPSSSKLKKIVIGIDYDLLGYDYKVANQMWMDRLYYKNTQLLYDSSFRNKLMASSNFFLANRDLSKAQLFSSKKNKKGNNDFGNFLAKKTDCNKRAKEHSINKYDSNLVQLNLAYLHKISQIAKNKNIEVVIVNYPKRDCYYKFYEKAVAIDGKKLLRHFSDTTGIIFIDLWKNENFVDKDFVDTDHLSKQGVAKTVKILFGE